MLTNDCTLVLVLGRAMLRVSRAVWSLTMMDVKSYISQMYCDALRAGHVWHISDNGKTVSVKTTDSIESLMLFIYLSDGDGDRMIMTGEQLTRIFSYSAHTFVPQLFARLCHAWHYDLTPDERGDRVSTLLSLFCGLMPFHRQATSVPDDSSFHTVKPHFLNVDDRIRYIEDYRNELQQRTSHQ